jgi:hypothetical protein
MVPLALTRTERRLVKASVAPSIVAAVVALGYAMVWYFSQAGPDDRWLVLVFCTLGYLPVWIALAAALRILGDLRASSWMDTRELAPATGIFALCAILTIFTTEYHHLEPSAPWLWASMMPAVSAGLVGAAWGMSLMRRWKRRDQSRWTPGIGAAR